MGLTTMFLRQWKDGRIKKMRAELEAPSPGVSIADLPMAGARWRRNPDGSWMRWSYLGEDWEPQAAPPALLQAAEKNQGVITWSDGIIGAWKQYDTDKPQTPLAERVGT